jgi:hypothetical protein
MDETASRTDKSKRVTADTDGCLSYTYTYSATTPSRIIGKTGYSDSNWTTTVVIYNYYDNPDNRIKSRTYAWEDIRDNIYYHYMDEDFLPQSTISGIGGRTDIEIRSPGEADEYGAIAFRYVYYAGTLNVYQKIGYTDYDILDPSSPLLTNLVATYSYYDNSNNRLSSTTLASADAQGNTYYHYIDENWSSQGYGRVDKRISASIDADGARSYAYTYFAGSSQAQYVYCYSDTAFTNLVATYRYDTSGNIMPASDELYADFGSGGFWKYSGSTWSQLTTSNADSFILTDEYSTGNRDTLIDFGVNGFWAYSSQGVWSRLTTLNAESFMPSKPYNGSYSILFDFGSNGFWKYSAGTWTKLTALNAEAYAMSGLLSGAYDTLIDFGSNGFWK